MPHCAYIHYLRPEIPIYCSEASKLIMQTFQDTGSGEQYINFTENFRIYENKKGGMSRAKSNKNSDEILRDIRIIQDSKKFKIDSIEVEPYQIDHSLPGVFGFVINTSDSSVAYTADIRFHGRRKSQSEKFVQKCHDADLDHILCEGTRINKIGSKTEYDVENDVEKVINSTKNLVVCTYPIRDLDRFLSFYNAAKKTGRYLVIDLKQAYLLKLFKSSNNYNNEYPKPTDKQIKIFFPRKSWGLITKNHSEWTRKQIEQDYDCWEREFLDYKNVLTCTDVSKKQKDLMFYCNDFQLSNLIDVKPSEGSSYIRSSTEPFNEEMELDQERVQEWLIHFGLLCKESSWNVTHVSGHGDADQISNVITGANSKNLFPIHTTHPDQYKKFCDNITMTKKEVRYSL